MQKDLKIGLLLGLVLVISAMLWLATRPSLSPIARMSGPPETKNHSRGSSHNPNSASALEGFVSPNEPAINESNTEGVSHITSFPPPNLEQARPMRSQGDDRDTLSNSAQYEQAEKIKTEKFHIVIKGQTLSSISQKYYGTAGKWKKIFDYNRNVIKDPNKLITGTKLIIPD
jgi:nucleoid-associated protein YgaU